MAYYDQIYARLGVALVAGLSLFSSLIVDATEAAIPCWLQSPMQPPAMGQIGISRSIALGKLNASDISKMRALEALCHSEGVVCKEDELTLALERNQLFNRALYFDSFQNEGNLYTYAGFSATNHELCKPVKCSISDCDPAWLCAPSTASNIGMLGISYRATSAKDQYNAAVENALLQAEYLYGVEISATKSLRLNSSSLGDVRILDETGSVNSGQREIIPYRLVHQCKNQSTLFTLIELDSAPESDVVNAKNTSWLKNPKQHNIDGAVGAVERMMASGLVSDQMKLAIERAAIQLAYEKNSQIKEQLVKVEFGSGGMIYVSQINEATRVNLKARVMQIHFEQSDANGLKVYAWVAAVNE